MKSNLLKKRVTQLLLPWMLLLALIMSFSGIKAQTTPAAGDVAIVGVNATNPDKFAFVILKNITTGTIINFTDNGFLTGTTGRTGEGFLTFTAKSNYTAGTVFSWTNGTTVPSDWSSSNPTNFSFNASGDQLFAFTGSTANWATQTGITLLFGVNYGVPLSSTSSASNTVQPTSLSSNLFLNLPATTANNNYFANGTSSVTSVTVSGTAGTLSSSFATASNWFTQSNASGAVTFPTYSITVQWPVTASAGANGTVSPSGVTNVNNGLSQVYNITPNSGYAVGDVLVDGSSIGAVSTYTFSNVTASHTISATFVASTPTVNLSVSTNSASEADATVVTVTATASAAVTGDQTVSLAVSGTGITADDYSLSNTTITIPDGSTTGSVTFTVIDDAIYEGTETATLTISTPSSGIILGSTTSQNITITDNDPCLGTTGDTSVTICNTFTWYGTTYTSTPSVAPTHTFTNASGCDSVVTLHLTINQSSTGDTTVTTCNTFTWYGNTYTSTPSVAPTHTFTNATGCDSVVTLHLTINQSSTGDTTVATCNTFTWYGTTYTSTPSVAPTHTFTNTTGCDSVVTLYLIINHSNTGDTTVTTCNTFTWYGITYTSTPSVAPTQTFSNASGCDSVVTLHLTINHSTTSSTSVTANNSYTWNGVTYTSSGTYTKTGLINAAGCDSTATLILTIISANKPPLITITSPSNGAIFNVSSTIALNAQASDSDGTITKVEFYNYGNKFAEDSTAPYSFTASGVDPGIYLITAKATDDNGATTLSDTVHITVTSCSGSGSIFAEGFVNIPGSQVTDLTTSPKYPNHPDVTAYLNTFEYGPNFGQNYGGRVRGYICAPVTGNYTFYIAGDDQDGLWVSTDEDTAHKVLVAYNESHVNFRAYYTYPSQKSVSIRLIKGGRYYIETLHKQATGNDHLSVAWQIPGGAFEAPIPGSRLSPYSSGSSAISNQNFSIALENALGTGGLKVTATPNPSSDYFTIRTRSTFNQTISIKVTDASGRIVDGKLNVAPNSTVQLGNILPGGIYFVELIQGNQIQRLKLVKQ